MVRQLQVLPWQAPGGEDTNAKRRAYNDNLIQHSILDWVGHVQHYDMLAKYPNVPNDGTEETDMPHKYDI